MDPLLTQTPDKEELVTVLPTSFGQQRLWFLDQLEPESSEYNRAQAIKLKGLLRINLLEQSFNKIVSRHESLRTTFASEDGIPLQIVAPTLWINMFVVDLREVPESAREQEVRYLIKDESSRPFHLIRGPLIRTVLLQLAEEAHILILVMHHIISDGWSDGVLLTELATLYEAALYGRVASLPPLPIQYGDYAHWQQGWLQSADFKEQLAYWQHQLKGEPVTLALPTDQPWGTARTCQGARHVHALLPSLVGALNLLSQREGVTLFMLLFTAFQVLLARYTGQATIVTGTPIANRHRSPLDALIGFFVNTLVFRIDLAGNPRFLDLLERVRQACIGAYAHQDLPFEKLVEDLQPQRSFNRTPLFQVMFGLNAPLPPLTLANLELIPLELEPGLVELDLSVELTETNEGLFTRWEYRTDLFDKATIARMAEHFQRILEELLLSPNQPIMTLSFLTRQEQQFLSIWNRTANNYTGDTFLLHLLFERQVEQTPDAVAVVRHSPPEQESEHLTYEALNRRSNQLAHRLQALGVGPETCVGVYADRSLSVVIAILGILKAGGVYVPLDPSYPGERLSMMLSDTHALVLITQQSMPLTMAQHDKQLIYLEDEGSNLVWPDCNPYSEVTPKNLAYIVYTSGTTGAPKGITISHQAICHRLLARTEHQIEETDRVLQHASLGFDVSIWEMWASLLIGAQVTLAQPGKQGDSHYLCDVINEQRITLVVLVPSVLRTILDDPGFAKMSTLRCVFCGGEALPLDLMERFFNRFDLPLYNFYGPSECSIDATFWICERNSPFISIGRPLPNTQIHLLDKYLHPVPIGLAGELYIGGDGLARGYLNQPQHTAEVFLPNLFSSQPGARLYKTGDLARYRADGTIEMFGRIDDQVKIRGLRIELREIEAVLNRHPAVLDSFVMVRELSQVDKRLNAYIVLRPGYVSATTDLHSFLQTSLPTYMIPSDLIFLDEFPLTPNGKIDRLALPLPQDIQSTQESECSSHYTPIEELLVGIWREVLKCERIGVNDNFFELGGHSLSAAQVMSRIRELFKSDLPLRCIFESPTVATLAKQVQVGGHEKPVSSEAPAKQVNHGSFLPLSFAQQRLYFLNQLEPDSSFYNMAIAMRVTGALNLAVLQQSMNEIIRRHETLRTTFRLSNGIPEQLISPVLNLVIQLTDLQELAMPQRTIEAEGLLTALARRPFDLAKGPLLRVAALWLAPEEYIVLFTLHHIICDEWSIDILIDELVTLYQTFSEGHTSPLTDLPIQYSDFTLWQRQWMQAEFLQKEIDFWKGRLAHLPSRSGLPTDYPRSSAQSFHGSTHAFTVSHSVSDALKALGRHENVTLFMVLLAAFKVLLHRYSGQDDIIVGTGVANRTWPETEGLIGFFVNMLVLRTSLSGNPSFRTFLTRVREAALDAYRHQDLPFEKLVEALQLGVNLGRTPLLQTVFVLQNQPMPVISLPGLVSQPIEVSTRTTHFELTLSMVDAGAELTGVLEYSTDLFHRDTILRMTAHFKDLLAGIVADPDTRLLDIPLSVSKVDIFSESSDQLQNTYTHDQFQF
ncbi:mycobactin peptide synthetase MbtE [Thermoflexales bacterium]|nr:mycobactin peptide synthetase MbtE [Thermoflexales bacterium]